MRTRFLLLLTLITVSASAQTYTYSTLAKFSKTSKTGSVKPLDLSMDSGGNFYGLATPGVTKGFGLVWKVTPTGTLSVLYNFTSTWTPASYAQTLAISGSYLYGMTSNLGIWKLNTTTKKLTLLSTANLTSGSLTLDSAGNLYGYGSSGLFKLTPTGTYTILYTFCSQTNCTDGSGPADRPIIDKNGNLYGTTFGGGAYGYGVVWELTAANQYIVLYSFVGGQDSGPDGAYPEARLSQDNQGNRYGTTYWGGSFGIGTVFKVDSSGTYTMLTDFASYADDYGYGVGNPAGPVILDSAGNLYGTTTDFGGPGSGTVWQFTTAGVLNAIAPPGTVPYAPNGVVVMDKSGNIYGTIGFPAGQGAVYKLTKN